MDQIVQRIEKFIGEEFRGGDTSTLGPEVSLLETGIIDSIGLFRLVGFLEESFGIRVAPEDLLAENFETIDRVVGYVRHQLAGRG